VIDWEMRDILKQNNLELKKKKKKKKIEHNNKKQTNKKKTGPIRPNHTMDNEAHIFDVPYG
jgi:hypothetical protein